MEGVAGKYTASVKKHMKSTDWKYKDLEAKLKKAVQEYHKGKIDKSEVNEAFLSYEEFIKTIKTFKDVEKDMQYQEASKNLKALLSSSPTGAPSGNKKGSAGSKGPTGGVKGVKKINPTEAPPGNKKGSAGSKSPPGGVTGGKQNNPIGAPSGNKKGSAGRKSPTGGVTGVKQNKEATEEEDTEKDDLNKIAEEHKKNLLEKEKEMKEITEQLQTLAKDYGIQGDSPEDIIRRISRELYTAKEQDSKVQTKRNIEELESNLEDVKKAVFGETDFKDHDIKKTKERIQELHRQQQDLHDLREAVLNAKDEKQTHTTKETIERVHVLHRNVQELESRLDNVIKALFRESEVEDKEHKIGKMQERIQGLHRQEEELFDLKKAVLHPKETKDRAEMQTTSTKETIERAHALHRTIDEDIAKIRLMEEKNSALQQQLKEQQEIQKNKKEIIRKLNDDLKTLQTEKERLLTRLSEVAGSKLTAGNPNITDLSDSNRPTKIAEQFSELYDNLWTDVFEKLCQNSNMSDRDAIKTLLQYLEKSYARCKEISTERYKNIVSELTLWRLAMPDPETSQKKGNNTPRGKTTPTEGKEKANISIDDFAMLQKLLDSPMDVKKVNPVLSKVGLDVTNLSYIKNMLKSSAEETSVLVEEVICKQMATEPNMEFVEPYVKKCVRLCWLMVVQDPPVYIKPSEETGSKFDKEYYREFLTSGKVLDYVVWPALLLHENGPLLHKGVAQPKAK